MIIAIAVMFLASGIIALSKSMKLNMSINITPNFKLEVCINEVNNVIFRNFADETTGKTIEVKNGISGIQGSNLIVDDKVFKDYGNEFTLIIKNYTTTTGIEVAMSSTATISGGGIGVSAEIESSKYIATQYSTGDADYVSFSVGINPVFPQTTMLKIKILECSDFMIQYDLDGGTNHEDNPTRYSTGNEIGLEVPTREGYEFVGWTGSNGTTPELLVDVEQGSTGHKTYTANWIEMQDYTLFTGNSFNVKVKKQTNANVTDIYVDSDAASITFDKYSKYARSFPEWTQGVAVDVDEVGNIKVFSDGTDLYVLSKGYINANPDASNMFYLFSHCETIDFSNFDTSNVVNMRYMFSACSADLSFLSDWDVSNVVDMSGLFEGYQGESLSFLSAWADKVSNVTDMTYMFSYCSVDLSFLSSWDVSNVVYMEYMFAYCSAGTINLSDWTSIPYAEAAWGMFEGCTATEITLSGWDISDLNDSIEELAYCMFSNEFSEVPLSVGTLNLSGWTLPEGYESADLEAAFEAMEGIENVVVS